MILNQKHALALKLVIVARLRVRKVILPRLSEAQTNDYLRLIAALAYNAYYADRAAHLFDEVFHDRQRHSRALKVIAYAAFVAFTRLKHTRI